MMLLAYMWFLWPIYIYRFVTDFGILENCENAFFVSLFAVFSCRIELVWLGQVALDLEWINFLLFGEVGW